MASSELIRRVGDFSRREDLVVPLDILLLQVTEELAVHILRTNELTVDGLVNSAWIYA